jgi:hypothetical protein
MSGRGRPAREPTAAEREKVKEYKASGASQRVTAAALGRSVPSLRKYFAAELGLERKGPREPPFKITAQMRDDVALMAAFKEPRGVIAKAIGVSVEDLEEFFADDLQTGAARVRLETLRKVKTLADLGAIGAVNKMAAMTAPAPEPAAADAPGAPTGKKAEAAARAAAAAQAGGKFAPRRPPPRLAVVGGKRVDGEGAP